MKSFLSITLILFLFAQSAIGATSPSFESLYRSSRNTTQLLEKTKVKLSSNDYLFLKEKFRTIPAQQLPRAEFQKHQMKLYIEKQTFVLQWNPENLDSLILNGEEISLQKVASFPQLYDTLYLALVETNKTSSLWRELWINEAHAVLPVLAIAGVIGSSLYGLYYFWESNDTRCTTLRDIVGRCKTQLSSMKDFLGLQFLPEMKELCCRRPSIRNRAVATGKRPSSIGTNASGATSSCETNLNALQSKLVEIETAIDNKRSIIIANSKKPFCSANLPALPGSPVEVPTCPGELNNLHLNIRAKSEEPKNSETSETLSSIATRYETLYGKFSESKDALLGINGEIAAASKSSVNQNITLFCSNEKKAIDQCSSAIKTMTKSACFDSDLSPTQNFTPTPAAAPETNSHKSVQQ